MREQREGGRLKPFKGRTLYRRRPVRVYRNLHNRGGLWSIVQDGLVVAHADRLCLVDVVFRASAAGMRRARRLGHRIVCGWAIGTVVRSCMGSNGRQRLPVQVTFRNPEGFSITGADFVVFNETGCTAAYTRRAE